VTLGLGRELSVGCQIIGSWTWKFPDLGERVEEFSNFSHSLILAYVWEKEFQ